MEKARVRPFIVDFLAALVILLVLAGGGWWLEQRYVTSRLAPDPTTIANASLSGLREQNRLSAFAARFVAVVTSRQSQFGLSAERTTIMPGMVRYEVDLGRLSQRDVAWDDASKTLSVRLPAVEVTSPAIDLDAIRSYGSGGVLMTLTDARETLDSANRSAGQAELMKQARAAPMMNMAKDATRRAVERSFAMPLKAAGIDAAVNVRFADDPVRGAERWDVSRSLEDVLGNRR